MGTLLTKGEHISFTICQIHINATIATFTTAEGTTHRIIFVKTSLYFIVLFFILQKCDYTLHYHKDTTSTLQQEAIRSTHNFLHISIPQTSTQEPLFRPQTLTNNVSTSSLLKMHKPTQDLNLIYIVKILRHLVQDPHLKPQRVIPILSSKSYIKTKRNKLAPPLKNEIKTYLSQNHTLYIP
jgi:hypothetical protein